MARVSVPGPVACVGVNFNLLLQSLVLLRNFLGGSGGSGGSDGGVHNPVMHVCRDDVSPTIQSFIVSLLTPDPERHPPLAPHPEPTGDRDQEVREDREPKGKLNREDGQLGFHSVALGIEPSGEHRGVDGSNRTITLMPHPGSTHSRSNSTQGIYSVVREH